MKKLLIGTLLILTACGGTAAPTPSGPLTFNVSGGWTGTITATGRDPIPLNLNLVQAPGSDDVTGTAYNNVTTSTLSGKLSSGVLTLKGNVTTASFIGTFTPSTYKGSYTTDNGSTVVGTFSFTKNQ